MLAGIDPVSLVDFCADAPPARIALLHKDKNISENQFNINVTLAFSAFTGIIFLPVYFLFEHSRWLMLSYLIIVLI